MGNVAVEGGYKVGVEGGRQQVEAGQVGKACRKVETGSGQVDMAKRLLQTFSSFSWLSAFSGSVGAGSVGARTQGVEAGPGTVGAWTGQVREDRGEVGEGEGEVGLQSSSILAEPEARAY